LCIPSDQQGYAEKPLKFAVRARYIHLRCFPREGSAPSRVSLNQVKFIGYTPSENNFAPPPLPKSIPNVAKRLGLFDTKPKTLEFKYQSDFDTNGLLYWIGCDEGKSTVWTNPATQDKTAPKIKLTTSHKMYNSTMKIENTISRTPAVTYFGGSTPQWLRLDMMKYRIKLTYFTLRHGYNYPNSYMQDFVFSGSMDGVTWEQIYYSEDAIFTRGFDIASFPVKGQSKYYRYFQLLQRGRYSMGKATKASAGAPYLCISGLELYGEVKIVGNCKY